MKPVRFWKMEIRRLSLTERMFFRDAIKTLLSWDKIGEECIELEVIRRILDSEIRVVQATEAEDRPNRKNSLSKRQLFGHAAEQAGLQSEGPESRRLACVPEEGAETESGSLIPFSPLPAQVRPI
ncbi:MAG: hypothetical protein P8Z71_05340 [Candidatus Sulfobium sp.]|jgi:hypothetical protein